MGMERMPNPRPAAWISISDSVSYFTVLRIIFSSTSLRRRRYPHWVSGMCWRHICEMRPDMNVLVSTRTSGIAPLRDMRLPMKMP